METSQYHKSLSNGFQGSSSRDKNEKPCKVNRHHNIPIKPGHSEPRYKARYSLFVGRVQPCKCRYVIWAPSSEFASSSIPSGHFNCACPAIQRGQGSGFLSAGSSPLALLVRASSRGSGETAGMCRLAWTFAARIGVKYQIRPTRSIWFWIRLHITQRI